MALAALGSDRPGRLSEAVSIGPEGAFDRRLPPQACRHVFEIERDGLGCRPVDDQTAPGRVLLAHETNGEHPSREEPDYLRDFCHRCSPSASKHDAVERSG